VNVLGFDAAVMWSAAINDNNGDISAPFLYGITYADYSIAPTSILCSFDVEADISAAGSVATVDLSTSSSLVAATFLSLTEVGGETLSLKLFTWTVTEPSESDGLTTVTFTGTPSGVTGQNDLEITITLMMSQQLGSVSVTPSGGSGTLSVSLTPTVLESVIRIQNWSFNTSSGSLQLNMGVVSGSGSLVADGTATTYSAGSGSTSTYFSASGNVLVDGTSASATVTFTDTSSTVIDNNNVVTQASGVYSASISYQLVTVTLGRGTDLTYDPAMGSGSPPPSSYSSSASSVALSALLMIMSVLLVSFVF